MKKNICLKKYINDILIIDRKVTNNGNDSGILKDWKAASKGKLPHWCYTKKDYRLLDEDHNAMIYKEGKIDYSNRISIFADKTKNELEGISKFKDYDFGIGVYLNLASPYLSFSDEEQKNLKTLFD